MPSRSLFSTLPPPSQPVVPSRATYNHQHHGPHFHVLLVVVAGTLTITFLILLFFIIFSYRKLSRNRTVPSDLKSPNHHHCRRFSYTLLRRATASFTPSNRLGHGGFGSVYKAVLASTSEALAVKVLDSSGSLQGEREFHNELSLAASLNSPHIVSLVGFSSDRRGRRLILVYELMENRSLQEALLDRKCEELMDWKKRFEIAINIAKGLDYLHHSCDPPVIHGDIKPSNILLDGDFNAKIGDFGLARLKTEDLIEEESFKKRDGAAEDNGSILEETESVVTAYGESGGGAACLGADQSPESCVVRVFDVEISPETVTLSPEVGGDKGSVSETCFDKISIDSEKDLGGNSKKGGSRRDWWWKQDNGGVAESGRVKDYVMEWIGSEIKKERPKSEWIASPSIAENNDNKINVDNNESKKERIRRKEKNRKPREWWKEEFCEELSKKKKTKKKRGFGSNSSLAGELWWQRDEEIVQERKKRKNKSSRGSIDWWIDGFSGEFKGISGRRNSQDWASGDIPKSGGISSTPSMRGTVCYIAPEYGGGGLLSEKCDVYSFGVLLLVLISGRRPLQVTASPMSEFERANLISWARQLAHNGKLLDLVDLSIHSLDKEQALVCITIALLCLQRSPSKRPTMREIVGMLSGQAEPPHLPFEFSPSPPNHFPFKSRKKAR